MLLLGAVIAISYAVHERSLYDDIDRALITSAGHTAAMADAQDLELTPDTGGYEVVLRLFRPDGTLAAQSPDARPAPEIDPRTVVRHPSGPPFDALGYLFPSSPLRLLPGSAFGLAHTSAGRWRVYAVPLAASGHSTGYIEAFTPLAQADTSLARLGRLLIIICLAGMAVELVGSCLVVHGALHTVGRITDTARSIAHSHDLSRRLTATPSRDEVGRLAVTFNEMLASLQEASAAQQRFVADASHELRAPLTAIQANLDLLRHHPELPAAERDESLLEAERESSRLTRLVADLLALARADAGVPLKHQPVDLDVVVLDAFSTARQLACGQQLVLESFEPVRILGDEDRLKQLLLILLDNALKYTPVGGQIAVGLSHRGAEVEMVVRDTGAGIDVADLPHVFERFYRADPGRGRDPGGTGLGLAIAWWITEQHGGTISIMSAPGQGATVTIHLSTEHHPPAAADVKVPIRSSLIRRTVQRNAKR
jgi:signal transduction histidine kinase